MGLETIVTTQKEYFLTDATKDVAFRKNALENLLESIYVNEKTIYDFTNDGTHFNGAGFSKYAYFCIKCGNSINYSHSYSYC